jgi:hypothetical protein
MEGIMFKQIEKLQQGAWPVIATVLVGTGGSLGYGADQAAKAQDPVGVGASLAALVGVVVLAAHAKGKNQLGRDQELGIRYENSFQIINAGNFVPAKKRYEDLNRQSTALTFAPGVVIATAGATALATAAFAPVAVALGCSVVLGGIDLAVRSRKENLAYNMEYAARDIVRQPRSSNPANVLKEACSFLGRQL